MMSRIWPICAEEKVWATKIGNRVSAPLDFALKVAFPNPFNSFATTTSRCLAGMQGGQSVDHDLNGRLIQTLLDGERVAGTHATGVGCSSQPSECIWRGLEPGGMPHKKLTLVKVDSCCLDRNNPPAAEAVGGIFLLGLIPSY
jgi:hypothetical protein